MFYLLINFNHILYNHYLISFLYIIIKFMIYFKMIRKIHLLINNHINYIINLFINVNYLIFNLKINKMNYY